MGRHYISELARPEAFQLFFDIDGLELEKLVTTFSALRALVGAPLVVTGTSNPPPGYHIFVPGKIVDVAMALTLRRQWFEAVPWLEALVDTDIYQPIPHLRLLGSKKISKDGVDMGRVHSIVGRFDDVWKQ